MRNPIVVGIDGSAASDAALTWAVRAAGRRGRPVRLVHAQELWPMHAYFGDEPVPDTAEDLRRAGRFVLDRALAAAREIAGNTPLSAEFIHTIPGRALVEQSRNASMLVVGSHGLGGLGGVFLGSVAMYATGHAACPVVVARPWRAPPANRIVVGIDGSPGGESALEFALDECELTGATLTALHAWSSADPRELLPHRFDLDRINEEERIYLGEAIAGWRSKHPDVEITQQVVHARPARALIDAAERARMIVVGSSGHGGFSDVLLGSVAQAVAHHAAGTVAVVRGSAADRR